MSLVSSEDFLLWHPVVQLYCVGFFVFFSSSFFHYLRIRCCLLFVSFVWFFRCFLFFILFVFFSSALRGTSTCFSI